MVSRAVRIVAYLASAALIFLGIVFMISTNLGIIYFFEGLVFLAVAGLVLFSVREKKPIEIEQKVTVTGPVKTKEVRCPNCGAIVDATKIEVLEGKPYVKCSYCGSKLELTEEPTF